MEGIMKQYNIFISHSWKHDDDEYKTLVRWLDNSDLNWVDFSVPMDDPIHTNGTDRELYDAISNKIRLCSVVLMMAGKSSSYSKWIDKEINIAKVDYDKPLLAISPWGNTQESEKVRRESDDVVGWNANSVIEAIRFWG
jgi:hypothetical protein